MGEQQNVNKNFSFRKAHDWAAGHQKQQQCKSTRSNCPSPSLLNFWTATGLVSPAAAQTHCQRGRCGWQPNLCAGDLNSGAGFPTDPGVFCAPLPTHSAHTQQAASCAQSLRLTCCHGEESLGEVSHATSETAPGCAVEQTVLLF